MFNKISNGPSHANCNKHYGPQLLLITCNGHNLFFLKTIIVDSNWKNVMDYYFCKNYNSHNAIQAYRFSFNKLVNKSLHLLSIIMFKKISYGPQLLLMSCDGP